MSKLSVEIAPVIKSQLTLPSYRERPLTDRMGDLTFGSSIPGGFMECSFKLFMSRSEAFNWYSTKLGGHLLISGGGQTVWEGRVDSIQLEGFGITVTALGYWSSLTDQILYQWWADASLADWRVFDSDEFAGFSSAKPAAFENSKTSALVVALREGVAYASDNPNSGHVYLLPTPYFVSSFPTAPNTIQHVKLDLNITNSASSTLRVRVFTASSPFSGNWTQKATYTAANNGTKSAIIGSGSEDIKAVAFVVDDTTSHTWAGNSGDARAVISNVQLWAEVLPLTTNRLTARRFIIANLLGESSLSLSTTMPQIARDTLYIQDPNLDLMPLIIDGQTLQDTLSDLMSYGDDQTPPNEYFAAVWDSRRFFFSPKEKTAVRWRTRLEEFDEDGLRLMQSLENFWSKVYVKYVDINDRDAFTLGKEETVFQSPALSRVNVINASVAQLAVANTLRDAFFEDFKKPQQRTEVTISGEIRNAYNAPEPLWGVRAGDLLFVEDLFSSVGGTALDPLRLFNIREESYEYEGNKLTITPDWPANRLDILVARLSDLGKES